MSKLLLGSGGDSSPSPSRAVSIYFVCTYMYVRTYNTLGYRYECRAAGPLGCQSTLPCWNNLVGQKITGNTPSDFFRFFLKIALRAWPIGSESGRPLPQTESDSFELLFFFPRITCMISLSLFSWSPLGSFQGSIKPWLWNIWNRSLELIDTLRFENPAWASGWESEGEVWISEFSNWRYKKVVLKCDNLKYL